MAKVPKKAQDLYMRYITLNPGITATELSKLVGESAANVSSYLNSMVSLKMLKRKTGCGPRGGYGYFILDDDPDNRRPERTVWQALLDED